MPDDFADKLDACRESCDFTSLQPDEKLKGLRVMCQGYLDGTDDYDWKSTLIDISNLCQEIDALKYDNFTSVTFRYVMSSSWRDELSSHMQNCIEKLAHDPESELDVY